MFVHFFRNKEEYNDGNYDIESHKHDFNGRVCGSLLEFWTGTPRELIILISIETNKLVFDTIINNIINDSLIGKLNLLYEILSSCPSNYNYISISNK
jgi:hypothetical protein